MSVISPFECRQCHGSASVPARTKMLLGQWARRARRDGPARASSITATFCARLRTLPRWPTLFLFSLGGGDWPNINITLHYLRRIYLQEIMYQYQTLDYINLLSCYCLLVKLFELFEFHSNPEAWFYRNHNQINRDYAKFAWNECRINTASDDPDRVNLIMTIAELFSAFEKNTRTCFRLGLNILQISW